jgi:hypothetical protein
MRRLFAFVGLATAAGAIILGLIFSGSPATSRMERQDQQRVMDLQQISYAIDYYYRTNTSTLPPSLTDIPSTDRVKGAHFFERTEDPFTGTPYEYRVTGPNTYELCAVFDLESPQEDSVSMARSYPMDGTWSHPKGRHCFPLSVYVDRAPYPY